MQANAVDLFFALLILYAMVRGYSKGLLGTAASYVAPVLAIMAATDWSAPARELLGNFAQAPGAVLDILAPVLVFVLVIVAVRLAAFLVAGLLGVGKSVPGRILASTAGALASAVVLGSLVLLVRQFQPEPHAPSKKDDVGDLLASPFEDMMVELDARFEQSLLAPRLADLASAVVSEAMAKHDAAELREEMNAAQKKAGEAASQAIENLKRSEPHREGGSR